MGAKAENYSFLKKLLENIKQTKDQQDPDNNEANERMYTVCDIAIGCVMNKNQTFTLKDFPGDLLLPRKLFLPDKTLHNTKSYIPPNFFAPQKQKNLLDVKGVVANKCKQKSDSDQHKKADSDSHKNGKHKSDSCYPHKKGKKKNDEIHNNNGVPSKRSRRIANQDSILYNEDFGSDEDI